MPNIFVSTLPEKEEIESLLKKQLPTYRQAYSDRTSWLMACISELSYIKFNPLFKSKSKDYFIAELSNLVNSSHMGALKKLIKLIAYDHQKNAIELKENAEFLEMELQNTFDNDGSQAILLSNSKALFLGFRGTEPTSMKDIKSDTKATTMACELGGKIHSGFNEAFNKLAIQIQEDLNKPEYQDKPLFITGHSLGGALTTIAAKKLTHRAGIAACYTFGSPRVGDPKWTEGIKTPIYRIVNAADPVTMLPPSSELISLLAWVLKFIPYIGRSLKNLLLSKFGGYYHAGDMRYLTNCKNKNYEQVVLLYSVSFLFRIKAFIVKKLPYSKILADHSIKTYRKKLKIIAEERNLS